MHADSGRHGDALFGGDAPGQTNLYLVSAVGRQTVQAAGQNNTLSFAPSSSGGNVNRGAGTVTFTYASLDQLDAFLKRLGLGEG